MANRTALRKAIIATWSTDWQVQSFYECRTPNLMHLGYESAFGLFASTYKMCEKCGWLPVKNHICVLDGPQVKIRGDSEDHCIQVRTCVG